MAVPKSVNREVVVTETVGEESSLMGC